MDEQYNVFLNNDHKGYQEKILLAFNYQVLKTIIKKVDTTKKTIQLLELGVGKGYFAQSCLKYNNEHTTKIKYSAFDRNKDMLLNLSNYDKSIRTYKGSLPELNLDSKQKFDIVYCAFVVEHLRSGDEVYQLISNIKKHLTKDGVIVFFTPDAMSQKFEFFNIDYTHHYPTTARNLTMAFTDAEVKDVECVKVNGLCTYPHFNNFLIRRLHKLLFKFYSYRLFSFVFYPLYRVPLYRLDNFFYQVFCFFKEQNIMLIAKK